MPEPGTFAFSPRHVLTLQPLSPQSLSRTLPVPKVSLLVVSLSALSDSSTLSLVPTLLATLVIDTFSSLSDGMSSNHSCGTSLGTLPFSYSLMNEAMNEARDADKAVSSLKDVPSNSSNGFTTNPIPSRRPSRSTRLSSLPMVESRRRSSFRAAVSLCLFFI